MAFHFTPISHSKTSMLISFKSFNTITSQIVVIGKMQYDFHNTSKAVKFVLVNESQRKTQNHGIIDDI